MMCSVVPWVLHTETREGEGAVARQSRWMLWCLQSLPACVDFYLIFQQNSHTTPTYILYFMRVELFFDCLSPFSYLAFQVLRRYQPVWGYELSLRPTLLGGIMVRHTRHTRHTLRSLGLLRFLACEVHTNPEKGAAAICILSPDPARQNGLLTCSRNHPTTTRRRPKTFRRWRG